MAKRIAKCVGILGFSLFALACSQTTPTVPTPNFISWSQANREAPKHVCVLPFVDKANEPRLATQVRQSFAGHLSIKHFVDRELHDIDSRLATLGPEWQTVAAQDLGRTLGCHALIYGEVTRASRLYLALYSQLTLEGRILVVEAETGQTLVEDSYATKFRSAGLPLSPLSLVPDAVRTFTNLSDTQMVRAVDDLGRNLAAKVPDLPTAPTSQVVATVLSPLEKAPRSSPPTPSPSLVGKSDLPAVQTVAQLESSAFDVPPTSTSTSSKDTQPSSTGSSLPSSIIPTESYHLQVAALRTSAEAQRVVLLLRKQGYQPNVTRSVGTTPVWHRVLLGPFPSIHAAQKIGARIHSTLRFSPIVTRPATP